MRKYAEANKPAIYRKMRINEMKIAKYTGGYPYSQNGLLRRSSQTEPIYSYAQNYKKFGKDFSLFMWTTEADPVKVSAHFDKIVATLKRGQIVEVLNHVRSFNYVEPYLV